MASDPLTAAAVMPVIAAELIAAAKPVTVLLGPTGTVTNVSLMYMLAPAVKVLGVLMPVTVGHEFCQSLLPITTQSLSMFL